LSRVEYWGPKLDRNIARDQAIRSALFALGWSVMVIWECEIGDVSALAAKVRAFLEA
jgi:DNA mismatch endonuclease (patch repair protein)